MWYNSLCPVDTGRKLNVLCTFILRPVSMGWEVAWLTVFSDNCIVCKNKRNATEKVRVSIASNFFRCSAENILQLFQNRFRRARVDQNYINFVFSIKNWFLGFVIPSKNELKDLHRSDCITETIDLKMISETLAETFLSKTI